MSRARFPLLAGILLAAAPACDGPDAPSTASRAATLAAARVHHAVVIGPRADLGLADAQILVRATWGSGRGQLGKRDEASRPGPMSMAAGAGDAFQILDQINGRVALYNGSGTLLRHVAISSEATEDVAMANGVLWTLVLVPGARPGYRVERYSSGKEALRLDLAPNIQHVTGVFLDGEPGSRDVWVEQQHDLQTLVVSRGRAIPAAAQRRDVMGRPDRAHPGQRLTARRVGRRQAVVIGVKPGETTRRLLDVHTPLPLVAIQELSSDRFGNIYLGLLMGQETRAGFSRVRKVMLVHGPAGQRVVEMAVEMVTDVFRPVVVSGDGLVYQMQTSEEGVLVRRWRPLVGGAR